MGVSRRPFSLLLVLTVALLSVLLNIVTNYLTSSDSSPQAFQFLRQWSLPALGIVVLLMLAGQGALVIADRPPKRRWNADRPPYPGLEAFTSADAGVFFGREREIEELLDRFHTGAPPEERFIAVAGPSGSGKSSLVHAGLVPRLAGRRHRWVVVDLVPEDRPVWNLARALASLRPLLEVDGLTNSLRADPQELGRQIDAIEAERSASVLLVIDQAEELFTLSQEADRRAVLELVRVGLKESRRFFAVATMRSDYLDEFMATGLTDLVRRPVMVGPLDRPALFRVIEEPAAQAGLHFAPRLVSSIVDDAGGGDALPLLAYTLESLYRTVRSGETITEADYERLGGVAGALAKQADRVVQSIHDVDRETVLATLLRFVTLDESGPARRRVHRRALGEDERRVVDAFVQARLLTSSSTGGEAVIEVAHEALFRHWPPLRQAVEARADELRGRAELERWAQDWERAGRTDAYLLGGERLQIAERWAAELVSRLDDTPQVQELLEHSRRLDRAAMTRLSEAIARHALAEAAHDPELAVLLALAALEECAPTSLANQALVAAMANPMSRVLRGHRNAVRTVGWSPAGDRIVTASQDRELRVWDAASGTELHLLRGHEEAIWGVAWSPDGRLIASASDDRTARIWDAARGTAVATLRGHGDWVRGLSWSPDGERLATASHDRTIRIWTVSDEAAERVVEVGTVVWHVAWSPDGSRIASASRDGRVRLWDPDDGNELPAIVGHDDYVSALAWSPDGGRIASASPDRTVRIDRLEAPADTLVLRGHTAAVWSVAWSHDGGRLATASRDRTVRLWSAETGEELDVATGHTDAVQAISWSADGDQMVSGSRDRTARVWQTDRPGRTILLRGHSDAVQALAWSPDGRRLASASGDHTARIWEPAAGRQLLVLRGHDDALRGVAWSPDGRRLVTVSDDRTAIVWDAYHGDQALVLEVGDWVRGVAWSPNGSRIATVARNRLLRIWDAATGEPVCALAGHQDEIGAVAWSPDGHLIATVSGDGTARVWDAVRTREVRVLKGHERSVWCVGWAPDSERLLTASDDHTARIWNAASGTEIAVLRGHEDWIRGATWSPDGRHVITGAHDGTARIWDASTGAELAIVFVSQGWVSAFSWSPDGSRIAIGAYDRTVVQEAVTSLDALMQRARAGVSRQLSGEERRRFGLPDAT